MIAQCNFLFGNGGRGWGALWNIKLLEAEGISSYYFLTDHTLSIPFPHLAQYHAQRERF